MNRLLAILAILSAIALPMVSQATEYHVTPETMVKAVTTIVLPGDVVWLASGKYSGGLEKHGDLPISAPPLPISFDRVLVDERGVYLHVSLQ